MRIVTPTRIAMDTSGDDLRQTEEQGGSLLAQISNAFARSPT
jgi:hypothetical protein